MNLPLGLLAVFFSGMGGLLLEVVWARLGVYLFGSTTQATTILFCLFLGGLALGNDLSFRFKPLAKYPFLFYAIFELVSASLAALLCYVYHGDSNALGSASYILFILLATTFMGFSIPLVVEGLSSRFHITHVYGVNTIGAAVGAISSAYFWIPTFGLEKAGRVGFSFLIIAATLSFLLHFKNQKKREKNSKVERKLSNKDDPILLSLAFYSGFVGLTLEILWTRMLSLILGPSVYALGIMLFVFLIGIGTGAYFEKYLRRFIQGWGGLASLLGFSALVLIFSSLTFSLLPYVFIDLVKVFKPDPSHIHWIELILSMLTLFPVAFIQGVLLPILVQMYKTDGGEGVAASRVLVWNTTGSISGAALTGLYFIPQFGFLAILIGVALCTLLISYFLYFFKAQGEPSSKRDLIITSMLTASILISLIQSWDKGILSSGVYKYAVGDVFGGGEGKIGVGEILYFKEGKVSTVAVTKTSDDVVLSIDGKADATFNGDRSTQVLLGALPLSLSRSTEKTLVIGYASGVTAGIASLFEGSHVTSVEIEPKVYEAAGRFYQPINYGPLLPPMHQMIVNDGRHFLKQSQEKYDVITSEPSNPWMSGVAPLFTKEFFELTKSKLEEGGVMCQWLPIYGMSWEVVTSVMKTFSAVFPEMIVIASVEGNDLLLIGSKEPIQIDPKKIESRWVQSALKKELKAIQIQKGTDLIGRFVIGKKGVDLLTEGARLNTDDNGYVEYRAPASLHLKTAERNDQRIGEFGDSLSPYLTKEARNRTTLSELRKQFQKRGKFKLVKEL